MALFKFRLPGQGEAAPEGRRRAGAATNVRKSQAAPTESVESLRQRARHRVIGASVLVVAAVIGFPMLFDSEPRPVDVNVPIAIPDRDNAPPLHASAERVAAQDSLNDHEEVVTNDPAPVVVPPPVRSSTSSAERSAVNAEAAAQAERDRAAQAAKDKAEQERAAKAAHEREARDKAAKEKAAKEKAAKDKAAKEKAAKERADRAEKEKAERAERTERADKLAHFVSCLVYLPRDRYTTDVRLARQDILVRELGGESILRLGPLAQGAHTMAALGGPLTAGGGLWVDGERLLDKEKEVASLALLDGATLAVRFALVADESNAQGVIMEITKQARKGDILMMQMGFEEKDDTGGATVGNKIKLAHTYIGVIQEDGQYMTALVFLRSIQAGHLPFTWGLYNTRLKRFVLGGASDDFRLQEYMKLNVRG